ncbi:MAG TPA: hypothetical protein VGD34_12480 [Kribbella sp.]
MTDLDHRKAPDRAAGKKPNRSHSAIGAAVVAGAAMLTAVAFILSNGNSTPTTDQPLRGGAVPLITTPSATPSATTAPSIDASKADRNPSPAKATPPPPNTGPESPTFRRGQWIAVLDTYPTDVGMAADQLAKNLAAKLIAAGVPAKAMLASGQYPGLANSNLEPIRDTWIVYFGPVSSSATALAVCSSPATRKAYGGQPVCPTYEPATSRA